jgi:hypothetical protein
MIFFFFVLACNNSHLCPAANFAIQNKKKSEEICLIDWRRRVHAYVHERDEARRCVQRVTAATRSLQSDSTGHATAPRSQSQKLLHTVSGRPVPEAPTPPPRRQHLRKSLTVSGARGDLDGWSESAIRSRCRVVDSLRSQDARRRDLAGFAGGGARS